MSYYTLQEILQSGTGWDGHCPSLLKLVERVNPLWDIIQVTYVYYIYKRRDLSRPIETGGTGTARPPSVWLSEIDELGK